MKKFLSLAALTFLLTSCGYLQIINPSNSSSSETTSEEKSSEDILSENTSEETSNTSISSLISSIFSSDISSSEFSSNSSMNEETSSKETSEDSSGEETSETTSTAKPSWSIPGYQTSNNQTSNESSSNEETSENISSEVISEISSEITTSIIDSVETSEIISSEYISSVVSTVISSELSSENISSEVISEVTSNITTSIIESIQTSEIVTSEVISSIITEIVTSEISSIFESSDTSSEESSSIPEEDNSFKLEAPNFDTPKIDTIENVTFEDLFNLGNKISIKAYVRDSELNKLSDDQKTGGKVQTYRRCDKVVITMKNYDKTFTWEFENVGIRQKGNTSRQSIWGDGRLNLNHFKLAFDETFSDTSIYDAGYVSKYGNLTYEDREFLNSLSGVDVKWNKNYDESHIKEIYASYLYQASGIISSHIGLADFSIVQVDNNNKEHSMGLCTLYEPASKSLIKRSLKNENKTYLNMGTWDEEKAGTYGVEGKNYGDYYECGWGSGSGRSNSGADWSSDSIQGNRIGIGDQAGKNIPAYERKTCTTVEYDSPLLKNLINTTNYGSYEQIEQVMDLEQFAIKEAITYYIGNPDGMRYNYNNYMIYIRRTDGKATIIPIDNDRCFGITRDWGMTDKMKNESPLSTKDINGDTIRNKLFSKTILSSSNNPSKDKYIEAVLAIRNSDWVKNTTFNSFYNKAKSTYSNHSFSLSDGNISFSDYILSKNRVVDNALTNNGGNDSGNSGGNSNVQNIKRIYFENAVRWSEVYCYVYGDYGDNGWPGQRLVKAGTRNGKDIYYFDIDINEFNYIIFNNGGSGEENQTEKISVDFVGDCTLFTLGELSERNRYNLYTEEINLTEIK